MSKQEYPYPKDEFDVLGQERVPQGVHREPIPRWRGWLPYLLVIVLVPVLTFAAVKYFTSPDSPDPTADPSVSAAPSDDDADDADDSADSADSADDAGEDADADDDADDPTMDEAGDDDDTDEADDADDPDESDDPNEDVDHEVAVLILNGANAQGLAGRMSEFLTDDGWLNLDTDNYTSATPEVSTVYYNSAEIENEAQAVAEQLGISETVESADAASNGIVVVLRTDFEEPS